MSRSLLVVSLTTLVVALHGVMAFHGMMALHNVASFFMMTSFMFMDGTVVTADLMLSIVMILRVVGCLMEVRLSLGVLVVSGFVQSGEVDVVVFNSVLRLVLHLVEKLIELVLDVTLKTLTIVILNIVHIGVSEVVPSVLILVMMFIISVTMGKAKLEVTLIGVLGNVMVLVMVHIVSSGVMLPVVGEVLDTMTVVVLVHMLGVVVTLILLRVVVAHVVRALGFDVMIFTMLLASKVTLITEVRLMVLQIPVALAEMSVGVLLDTMGQDMSLVALLGVVMLVRSLLTHKVIISDIVFFGLGLGRLGSSGSSLLFVVHLLVEESSFWAHVLFSFSLSHGGLSVMVWVVMIGVLFNVSSSHSMVEIKTTMSELLILTVWVVVLSILFMIVSLGCVWVSMSWVLDVGSVISIAWELFVETSRSVNECLLLAKIFTAHATVVLFSTYIVVLVSLLQLLALLSAMSWGWLGLGMLNRRVLVSIFSMEILRGIRLHLEDKLALFNESLRCTECG